jgi:hypothetical protein
VSVAVNARDLRNTNFQLARGRPSFAKLTALPVSTERVATGVTRQAVMRMSRKSSVIAIAALVACAAVQFATPTVAANMLTPDQAPLHIGETATVCGVVVSTRYAAVTKGQPTFLSFDLPYPHQIFTVVIWGSDRPKFGTPETMIMGKRACATGTIQSFRGKAEIIATDPRQLVVQ